MAEVDTQNFIIDTHPLENLITAPLQAIIESQRITTSTILEYILSLTDLTPENARQYVEQNIPIPLKTTTFSLSRNVQSESGHIETKNYDLNVPLITMFPVPYLAIQNAELSFNFKVIDVIKNEDKVEKDDNKTSGGLIRKRSVIQTRYTSSKSTSSESTSDISIKINVSQSDVPMGLAKFLTNASSAITEKEREKS